MAVCLINHSKFPVKVKEGEEVAKVCISASEFPETRMMEPDVEPDPSGASYKCQWLDSSSSTTVQQCTETESEPEKEHDPAPAMPVMEPAEEPAEDLYEVLHAAGCKWAQ